MKPTPLLFPRCLLLLAAQSRLAESLEWDWQEEQLLSQSPGHSLPLQARVLQGLSKSGITDFLDQGEQSYSLALFAWDASFKQRSKARTGECLALILYTV